MFAWLLKWLANKIDRKRNHRSRYYCHPTGVMGRGVVHIKERSGKNQYLNYADLSTGAIRSMFGSFITIKLGNVGTTITTTRYRETTAESSCVSGRLRRKGFFPGLFPNRSNLFLDLGNFILVAPTIVVRDHGLELRHFLSILPIGLGMCT